MHAGAQQRGHSPVSPNMLGSQEHSENSVTPTGNENSTMSR